MLAAALVTGCGDSSVIQFGLNEVELLRQEKISLPNGEHFPDHYRNEISEILDAVFGTPDDPKFPVDDDSSPVKLENLIWSAGRVHSDIEGRPISGLYREHCAHCHGISGNGAGPSAAFLNPYPRDFRYGKFKFKSTPLRKAPTDHDLERTLRNGIPGTAMPSFKTLPDEEIRALVDYVKYLSIRGEFERLLMSELSTLQQQPLLDTGELTYDEVFTANENNESLPESTADQVGYLVEELLDEGVLNRWRNPEKDAGSIPEPPETLDPANPQHNSLVEKGRKVYFARGNCAQCHGDTAMGDALTVNYDDWTNDWIKTAGVDPNNRETYRDFKQAGALKPRPVRPRNLRMPFYRGGSDAKDLYRRILYGIEGTPMPAGTTLSEDEIWALVAFVKWLPRERVNESTADSTN